MNFSQKAFDEFQESINEYNNSTDFTGNNQSVLYCSIGKTGNVTLYKINGGKVKTGTHAHVAKVVCVGMGVPLIDFRTGNNVVKFVCSGPMCATSKRDLERNDRLGIDYGSSLSNIQPREYFNQAQNQYDIEVFHSDNLPVL